MISERKGGLLASWDAKPVNVVNADGRSLFLLLGDHAGNCVPEALGDLGLPAAELNRHIALDLGVAALGERLASSLDATFIAQRYSRLVIDCNRSPDDADSVAVASDGTPIPGNAGLTDMDRAARREAIFAPYHRAIADTLAARDRAERPTIMVALHSFTPQMAGDRAATPRPWQLGVLHDGGDPRFALDVLAALQAEPGLTVGDNEPYRMDATDYTVPLHAFAALRPYVELEVRQDQLASEGGIARIAQFLERALQQAAAALID